MINSTTRLLLIEEHAKHMTNVSEHHITALILHMTRETVL